MRSILSVLAIGLAVCAAAPRSAIAPPAGAMIERDGFATIVRAPPAPYQPPARRASCWELPVPSSETRRPTDDFEILDYRCMRGISLAQARSEILRLRADAAEAQALRARLRQSEADNFVELSVQRLPVAAWKFTFKHDPEATLRRYTSNPRFVAGKAAYTPAEQDALRKALWAKLGAYASASGSGPDGVVFEMKVTEAEFRSLPQFRDFTPPPGVRLEFPMEPDLPAVTSDAAPFVRIFPRQRFFPGIILTGLSRGGRIVLRDGCLFLGNALVRLNRTAGLFRDAQGYLAVRDRADPSHPYARIGEEIVAASPNGQPVSDADRKWITSQCGDYPIVDVFSPSSMVNWDKWTASLRSNAVPVPPEHD